MKIREVSSVRIPLRVLLGSPVLSLSPKIASVLMSCTSEVAPALMCPASLERLLRLPSAPRRIAAEGRVSQ